MAESQFISQKNISSSNKGTTDVNNLIRQVKIREKKEKRNTIYIATAAITALAVSGYIISL